MVFACSIILNTPTNLMITACMSFFFGILRLLISMGSLNLPVSMGWNIVTFLLTCYRYLQMPEPKLLLADGTHIVVNVRVFVLVEAFAFSLVMVATAMNTGAVESEIRHQVSEAKLKGECAATTRLLELICDVVVELDGNFAIDEKAPRFAAMLCLNPACMRGTCLQDYMLHDEDKHRFEAQLAGAKASAEGSLPGVLHITFRDSCGTRISAEVFHVHFRNSDGEDRFLAGIQETPDYRPVADLRPTSPFGRLGASSVAGSEAFAARSGEESEVADDTGSAMGRRSSRSSSITNKCLLNRSCSRTTKRAEDLSLLGCLLTWNVAIRGSACCAFHCYVGEAQRSLTRLHSRRCIRNFCPVWEAQCEQCGLFALWDQPPGERAALECGGCHAIAVKKLRQSWSL
mmetsp:Transcript_91301/g.263473  ORF Transcript_91301/g.263473 Transcript_91301/m.263473 type:complete len:402 (-) Transcript_91301:84-1289(-)